MNKINILYKFKFPSDEILEYPLILNAESLTLEKENTEVSLPWVALEFNQCPNCPLDTNIYKNCPVAENIARLVNDCERFASHDQVHVEVVTPERSISAETTMQRGLSSLLGLMLAASGCPHTAFFRPMARFHLPLASEDETIYRATSMFLLAQYFIYMNGEKPDLDFSGLEAIYKNVQMINKAMSCRLRLASESDAAVNAVILLDLFAKALPYSIADSLHELEYLFKSYLRP